MDIILKGGPLAGQRRQNLPDETIQYTEDVAGLLVIYMKTDKKFPVTELPIFAFKEIPEELKTTDFGDA